MITGGYFGAKIASYTSAGYTNILNALGVYNVSGDGIFTSARVGSDLARSAKVGTWYNTGTNTFKNRDYASIEASGGDVTIYGLNIEAVAGDYVGIYDSGNFWNAAKSRWYYKGDGTVNEYTYATASKYWTSLYMEGNEAGGSKAFMHYLRHLMAGGDGRQC
jgi:hypothetical protein